MAFFLPSFHTGQMCGRTLTLSVAPLFAIKSCMSFKVSLWFLVAYDQVVSWESIFDEYSDFVDCGCCRARPNVGLNSILQYHKSQETFLYPSHDVYLSMTLSWRCFAGSLEPIPCVHLPHMNKKKCPISLLSSLISDLLLKCA